MPGFHLPICTEMSQLKSTHSYGISDAPVKLLPNVGFRSRIFPEYVKKNKTTFAVERPYDSVIA